MIARLLARSTRCRRARRRGRARARASPPAPPARDRRRHAEHGRHRAGAPVPREPGDELAPIIILSAMIDLHTRVAGLEAGAVDYVTKPFDPRELRCPRHAHSCACAISRTAPAPRRAAVRARHPRRRPRPRAAQSRERHRQRDRAAAELLPPELIAHDTGRRAAARGDGELRGADCASCRRQLLGFRSGELELEPARVSDLVDRALHLAQSSLSGVEVRRGLRRSTARSDARRRCWCRC